MTFKLLAIAPAILLASQLHAATYTGLLLSDQTLDRVTLFVDANQDGDTDDPNEARNFFDGSGVAGYSASGPNIFAMAANGAVHYAGDGATDTVYRLEDQDADGSANGMGEASVWFSADNASGLDFHTPNGVSVGPDGAIYIVEADVRSDQTGDFVYRTQDLNGDGDANDAGEAEVWLDLKALNPSSSPFEIVFDGDTAYIADTAGSASNVIYTARDIDGSGTVDASEVSVFIDDINPFNVPVDFAITANDGSVYSWEFLDLAAPPSLFQLTDLDGSGAIDNAAEAVEVWNASLLPDGFETFVGFDVESFSDGTIALLSNGGSPAQDGIYLLNDFNGDGDYLDTGETSVFTSGLWTPDDIARPRSVNFYSGDVDGIVVPSPVPLPAGAMLLLSGLFMMRSVRRKA